GDAARARDAIRGQGHAAPQRARREAAQAPQGLRGGGPPAPVAGQRRQGQGQGRGSHGLTGRKGHNMATSERYFYGTGRRKTAVARVRLYPGSGEIMVNGKGYMTVFTRGSHQAAVTAPLRAAQADSKWNVQAKVVGG